MKRILIRMGAALWLLAVAAGLASAAAPTVELALTGVNVSRPGVRMGAWYELGHQFAVGATVIAYAYPGLHWGVALSPTLSFRQRIGERGFFRAVVGTGALRTRLWGTGVELDGGNVVDRRGAGYWYFAPMALVQVGGGHPWGELAGGALVLARYPQYAYGSYFLGLEVAASLKTGGAP